MKTNYQRGFKANKPRRKDGTCFTRCGVFADIALFAAADHASWYGGNRRVARSARGAKKFINSRFRHHENAAARRLASGQDEPDSF
jgi:hypothetical protein